MFFPPIPYNKLTHSDTKTQFNSTNKHFDLFFFNRYIQPQQEIYFTISVVTERGTGNYNFNAALRQKRFQC